jgi:hypothetical protein
LDQNASRKKELIGNVQSLEEALEIKRIASSKGTPNIEEKLASLDEELIAHGAALSAAQGGLYSIVSSLVLC